MGGGGVVRQFPEYLNKVIKKRCSLNCKSTHPVSKMEAVIIWHYSFGSGGLKGLGTHGLMQRKSEESWGIVTPEQLVSRSLLRNPIMM